VPKHQFNISGKPLKSQEISTAPEGPLLCSGPQAGGLQKIKTFQVDHANSGCQVIFCAALVNGDLAKRKSVRWVLPTLLIPLSVPSINNGSHKNKAS
jgi:hypothetical protein